AGRRFERRDSCGLAPKHAACRRLFWPKPPDLSACWARCNFPSPVRFLSAGRRARAWRPGAAERAGWICKKPEGSEQADAQTLTNKNPHWETGEGFSLSIRLVA